MKVTMRRALALVTTFVLLVSMTPCSNIYAASKPKLSKTKATIEAGGTTTLSVKNYAKGSIKWTSGAKTIATVTQKGKVTGVKAGSTKITAKVNTEGKTYSLKCTVTVTEKTTRTVKTAKQLQAALKDKNLTKITLKSTEKTSFTIPKGTYSNVSLVLDTPNADITNNGVFKSITIKGDNFKENSSGNTLKVSAKSAHIRVAEQARLAKLSVTAADANVVIVADGAVDSVAVNAARSYVVLAVNKSAGNIAVNAADATLALSANGTVNNVKVNAAGAAVAIVANKTVKKVTVNAAANIAIGGTAGSVPVTVSASARGAAITANMKVEMTVAAEAAINLNPGAEGSKVSVTKKLEINATDGAGCVFIKNDTGQSVALETPTGLGMVDSGSYEVSITTSVNPVASGSGNEGISGNYGGETAAEVPAVLSYSARIGNTKYVSLQAAVNAADTQAVSITLLSDIAEDITIDTGKDITLKLNGHNITNAAVADHHTITVVLDAKLTIEGEGTVDNVSQKMGAILNNGTVILNGGTYYCSKKTGGWFTIFNHGTMTINSGVTVTNAVNTSSLIENGYYSYEADYRSTVNAKNPTLTINAGSFQGGLNAIENDDGGILVVNGGNFTDSYLSTVLNHNVATINGGTFTVTDDPANPNKTTCSVDNCGCGTFDLGTLTVNNGTFSGGTYAVRERSTQAAVVTINNGTYRAAAASVFAETGSHAAVNISDGTFTPALAASFTKEERTDDDSGNEPGAAQAAKIGSQNYQTLQDAINSASAGAEITLLACVNESVTVPAGRRITLKLNGHTITNRGNQHTIVVELGASLTITENGKVDNVSHGKGAIFNNGTVILNGGIYDRSAENGQSAGNDGGNSCYTICNNGTMTINNGVTVQTAGNDHAKGRFSPLIENGYQSYLDEYNADANAAFPTLTIHGGTFRGGLNTIKNDNGGILTITGGVFQNYCRAVVQNHNIATIRGGTFTVSADSGAETYGVENCGCQEFSAGVLDILGGTFTGASFALYEASYMHGRVTVTGGTFAGTVEAVRKRLDSVAALRTYSSAY